MLRDDGRESVAVEVPSSAIAIDVHGDPVLSWFIVAIGINNYCNRFRPHPRDPVGWINT